jgi:2-methylcitrate dehydratase PrpD
MSKWTTGILADYVGDMAQTRLDAAIAGAAANVLIDLIGCAAGGFDSAAAEATRQTVVRLYADGPAVIWFGSAHRRAEGAAMANSTAASALDLDDGHRRAGGHPGAAIVPTVLAVGPTAGGSPGASGRELIAAIAAGYEVAVRIAAARDFKRLDTLSTGRWCAYGTVAAAGLLGRDDPVTLAQAFAIAGVLSPGLSAAGYSTVMGNQAKEGIPWAVMTGLTALEMARRGFTGPLDILDHPDYFDAAAITAGLGTGSALQSVYFKPYACCRWIHSALDAIINLVKDHHLAADDIQTVDVFTFERTLRLNNYADPATLEGAQYSLPFCLAVAAVGGAEALMPFSPDWLQRPDIVALARRVNLHIDPELDAGFPAETGARVCLQTAGGVLEKTVRHPFGDPANPIDKIRLTAKFKKLSAGVISPQDQLDLLALIDRLADLADIAQIMDCLRGSDAGDAPLRRSNKDNCTKFQLK